MFFKQEKRLFFGSKVDAPWPSEYPKARLLNPNARHLTIAFLGNVDYSHLKELLPTCPTPPFTVAPVGIFDSCLLLPNRSHARVLAWHAQWNKWHQIVQWQQNVSQWLKSHNYHVDERALLSHITIGRFPFDASAWEQTFTPLPVIMEDFCLFESVGNLTYEPLWHHSLIPPFIELSHTADIAFIVQAESIPELYLHAQIAMAFKEPALLRYITLDTASDTLPDCLDDTIIQLNRLITLCDAEEGCSLKAVSFHGNIKIINGPTNIYQWEMIIDV